MPAFPFLFSVHPGPPAPGEKTINLPPQYTHPGETVVANEEAIDLVAYLLSLDHTYPILASADDAP
jgi:cytochrome c oxidase cbb3-type subunit 2